MRKVKFTHMNYHDKLTQILTDFPRLDDVHPFYADLINVLYDRDHFKLALGQMNIARQLIDKVGKDYVKLLKYGDSLYRCKTLKRAALGRMCTIMKRQKGALEYLEQARPHDNREAGLGCHMTIVKAVRQHMMRLPSIDPTTRTLIVAGYPNVGKSSFMNKVTRANVDVQPYAFTTKSLYVGHMDYKYLRWQVIDTPGVLDKPLEERNTIEMQSITALAHLQCCVLYVVDISEQCGYSIEQQVALFESIKPLFQGKPLVVAVNKVDVRGPDELRQDELAHLQRLRECGAKVVFMSTLAEPALVTHSTAATFAQVGLVDVKNAACDLLLAQRVETKLSGSKVEGVINRLRVSEPAPRDSRARGVSIPKSVLASRDRGARTLTSPSPFYPAVLPHLVYRLLCSLPTFPPFTLAGPVSNADSSSTDLPDLPKRRTQRDEQEEHGGAGVYSFPLQRQWELKKPEWVDDCIPEIMDGKNIFDFVDPEIEAKLEELEAEEEERAALAAAKDDDVMDDPEEAEAARKVGAWAKAIRKRKGVIKEKARVERKNNHPTMARSVTARGKTITQFVEHMDQLGVKTNADALPNLRGRAVSRGSAKEMELCLFEQVDDAVVGEKRARSASVPRD
ncbi:MAG: hypothetical protein SGPRY_009067, partial [Prymnesium sp.]